MPLWLMNGPPAMAEDDGAGEGDSLDNAKTLPLDELKTLGRNTGAGPELDVILDIPVRISMEVGSTQIPIRNLLQLNQGSVVESWIA